MQFSLRKRKSAGVPVSAAVHRLIRAGNAARDAGDWGQAASSYREVVAADPSLHHIWVQLGHALSEHGRDEEAVDAYARASLLKRDAEPFVHMGHRQKRNGAMPAAARSFAAAVRVGVNDADALDELQILVSRLQPVERTGLLDAVRHEPADDAVPAADADRTTDALDTAIAALDDAGDPAQAATGAALKAARDRLAAAMATTADAGPASRVPVVFDISDLIAHFRNHRLPTGIQRVQIEVVSRALRDAAFDVRICCFIDGCETLLGVPSAVFLDMAELSVRGKSEHAPEWRTMLARLFLHLAMAEPFRFVPNDNLINLGTSWWIYNYFLIIRNAKHEYNIRYIPFVHDFIPVMVPEHCVTGVIEDYVSWLIGVFHHADFFIVNSQSTGNDLVQVGRRLGHEVDPSRIEVVPLDADFRRATGAGLPRAALRRWQLEGRPFALLVSTIESRKNHLLALNGWDRLIADHGVDAVPMLVCVGRNGWLNDAVFALLARNPRLRERVLIIERASDEELALLYRECLFTVYPSHYEGWGLPVTEALCYGRVPVAADNSSLPEAGGEFALYFTSNSLNRFVAQLERILFEAGLREAMERRIADAFEPRLWSAITRQILHSTARLSGSGAAPIATTPVARFAHYYPVALHKGVRVWHGLGSGEVFRAGTGWLWPEARGSRVWPGGGELRIGVPATAGALRLYLRLHGLDSVASVFVVTLAGRAVARGVLGAGETRWVLADLPASDGEPLSLVIGSEGAETIRMRTGGTEKQLRSSISVVGFALCEAGDEASRLTFLQAAGLGSLDDVNAYCERGPTYDFQMVAEGPRRAQRT